MSLTQQIESDVIVAMKAREQEKLDALRMVRAALKNEQIALRHELTDDEVQKVLRRLIKQRKEAAEQFRTGGRAETADKEEREATLIAGYLPTPLSDTELEEIVKETIAATGATSAADFDKVMGQVMAKTKGQADGTRVAKKVKDQLGAN